MRTKVMVVLIMTTMMIMSMPASLTAGETSEKLLYEDRNEIGIEYRWNLADIFLSVDAWNEAATKIEADIPRIASFKGSLGGSPDRLADALEMQYALGLIIEDLYVYANQNQHTNTRSPDANKLLSRSQALYASFIEATAFITPEISLIDEATLMEMAANERLIKYQHLFDNILRTKTHIRSQEVESVLAAASLLQGAPTGIYNALTSADISWPTIKGENGEDATVMPAQFYTFMGSQDRRVRRDAALALFHTFEAYGNTTAETYAASINKDVWLARTRGYGSTLEAALDQVAVPRSVVDTLVDTVHENYGVVHKYVALRKAVLGIDDFHIYDLYVSMVPEASSKKTFDEGWALATEFWHDTFGEEYAKVAERARTERWIDVYTNTGKRGGAYSWGTYNSHPYLLLNWGGEIDDVFTLVHEMGHSIHSYLANKNQGPHNAEYSMFVAEVASVASESLFFEWLLARTDDPTERLAMLNYRMNSITGTFLRQIFFHEFEAKAHAMAENGEPITKESLNEVWGTLWTAYYGPESVLDEEYRSGWARIPHFYRTFYVWNYATSFAAGEAISARFASGDKSAVTAYLETLKLGGSVYPMDALKRAGVDMNDPKVIQTVMIRYSEILDEIAKLLTK